MTAQPADAIVSGKLSRGKLFAPTTEQSDLLNNRRTDGRAEEKDRFDGNPPSGGATAASRLLREAPELNMAEIADRVGFSDSLYFSKCFKEEFGMSPTAYRKA